MIFTPPRFVVVDDKIDHVQAIVRSIDQLGSSCLGIHYDPAVDLDPRAFRGVRALFLDLHLLEGAAETNKNAHYALIVSILESSISERGGPFIIILWTTHDDQAPELIRYLDSAIDPAKPHARPLQVIPLAKSRFLAKGSDPTLLQTAINEAITSSPQLFALLRWESDVLGAAGETLTDLIGLVPSDKRSSVDFPPSINLILSRLARDAVGPRNTDGRKREAITTAIAPILLDRVMHQKASADDETIWDKAATRCSERDLFISPEEVGQLNRALHISPRDSETLKPDDWGAVVEWPFPWSDDEFERIMGLKLPEFLGGELQIEKGGRQNCRPFLVRIGAACDAAQLKAGPLTYLMAVEVPESTARKHTSEGKPIVLTDAIWTSPLFTLPNRDEPFRLHVHMRFPFVTPASGCQRWIAAYRLREQLLTSLVHRAGIYSSRMGIVEAR